MTAAAATREMKTSRIRRGIIHVTVFKSADNIVLHNGIDPVSYTHLYKPEGMKYVSYDLDTKLQTANMNYLTENKKYYYMYVSKKATDSQEVIEIDGKIMNQHLLSVEYLDKGVKVEQIQEDSGRSRCV